VISRNALDAHSASPILTHQARSLQRQRYRGCRDCFLPSSATELYPPIPPNISRATDKTTRFSLTLFSTLC